MRTTVDLPDDLHRIVSAIAKDRGTTLSEAISQLLLVALGPGVSASLTGNARTGPPVVRLGRVVTSEDVRSLDDEA